ncbi:MAG: hypothetical protein KA066_01685 [Candidatus Pacebacteria bacterium]|nr:hypothetical protein [Candidatus Paceibacterota bacterium]
MTTDLSFFVEDKRPLQEIFPPMSPEPDQPLPVAFDDTCRRCGRGMERMYPSYRTRRKPYATFQCTNDTCLERLLVFDAVRAPFMIWASKFYQWLRFSDLLDDAVEQRERQHAARAP